MSGFGQMSADATAPDVSMMNLGERKKSTPFFRGIALKQLYIIDIRGMRHLVASGMHNVGTTK
jgi:hypothetical protein